MKVYRGFSDKALKARPRSVAIGIFDGMHRGHQKILKKTLEQARKLKATSCAVTFDPHPARVLFPGKSHPAVLMSLAHRLEFFKKMGIREALVIPFDSKFSRVRRESFVENFLLKRLGMKSLCVGRDFRFGHKALGDENFLRQASRQRRFAFSAIEPVKFWNETISSTRIRTLIEKGRLEKAEKMLGRPVSAAGTVLHGRGRGKSTGFPTANLNPHHEALPPAGVYAAFGYLNGKRLKGIIHIGRRPTFGDKEKSLEVHFFDFNGNIYGKEIELIFVARLRGTKRFRDPAALAKAIRRDSAKARRILTFTRPFLRSIIFTHK